MRTITFPGIPQRPLVNQAAPRGRFWVNGAALGGVAVMVWLSMISLAPAQVPAVVGYQGRVSVGGAPFNGAGQLKFALISPDGSQTFWRNSADLDHDGQPDTPVFLAVTGGLFSVGLGDTAVSGMAPLPPGVFTNAALSLRIWFDDGVHGGQQLVPDQPINSTAYALMAGNIADGAVTLAKLSTNAAANLTASLAASVSNLTAQLSSLTTLANNLSNQYSQAPASGTTVTSSDPQDPALLGQGYRLAYTLAGPPWVTSAAPGAPSPRTAQAGVWTGQSLIIWGGNLGAGASSLLGAAYLPGVDLWQPLPSFRAPEARSEHAAIWSGQEMLVWGGSDGGSLLNSGARFNSGSGAWVTMSTSNAPSARVQPVAAWTGSRLIIWGGLGNSGLLEDGAAYDPAADQWTPLPTTNAPTGRYVPAAVWAGDRLVVWGGMDSTGYLTTGSVLQCDTNGLPIAWTPMNPQGAPSARSNASGVWNGRVAIVWGGVASGFLGDGAAYDPLLDTWTPLSRTNAPSPRGGQAAVWTGAEMLIFGGETDFGTAADGAAYDPGTDHWRTLTSLGNPLPRSGATAAWSGTELLVFGGFSNGQPLAGLQRLNPQPTWYLYRKP